jgi:hypothetical protein
MRRENRDLLSIKRAIALQVQATAVQNGQRAIAP